MTFNVISVDSVRGERLHGKLKSLSKTCAEFAQRREHRPHLLLGGDEGVADAVVQTPSLEMQA